MGEDIFCTLKGVQEYKIDRALEKIDPSFEGVKRVGVK